MVVQVSSTKVMSRKGYKKKPQPSSDLMVIVKAKELCKHVMNATKNMPKQYRHTLSTKMQGLAIELVEALYMANEIYIGKANLEKRYPIRRDFQQLALTKVKMLTYFLEEIKGVVEGNL